MSKVREPITFRAHPNEPELPGVSQRARDPGQSMFLRRCQTAVNIAVGFDLDHTLCADNHLEYSVLRELLSIDLSPAEVQSLEAMIHHALTEYREQGVPLITALGRLFHYRFGSEVNVPRWFFRFRDLSVERVATQVRARNGLHEMFVRLRVAGAHTAVLTNGWNPLQRRKLAALGITAPLVVSDDLRVRKPSLEAFAALRAVLAPADQFWFVGDDPVADIAGARRAGFHTIWYDEGESWPQGLPGPDLRVRTLLDVADFLERSASRHGVPEPNG